VKQRLIRALTLSGLTALGALALSEPARACGGFFCSQQGLVNQAAERIVFADNGDGTVTAVIQIQYQGPADKFSWLLPIGSVPEKDQIAVSSDYAFSVLQQATNPSYTLLNTVEGSCREPKYKNDDVPTSADARAVGNSAEHGSVSVDASGEVGNFDYAVISVDGNLSDPSAPAVEWLHQNGYDVTAEGVALLGPYLADGMHLLALRLTKGSDTGSIRPIEITYRANAPMIPIKLTAVAATQDMGVLTWALSNARAVPFNYNSLELNEARINWFNAASNYNQVVTEAADAAGGQGFVTEYAAPTSQLVSPVWSDDLERSWQEFGANGPYGSLPRDQFFEYLWETYGTWSGFWDVARKVITPPPGNFGIDDLRDCPSCISDEFTFDVNELRASLDTDVIEPVRRFQRLIDRTGYMTRLYTTLSAAEMIVDPVFRFNPDLPDVSNTHTAKRVTECRSDLYASEAPWRIEFGNGSVLRGTPGTGGPWPDAVAAQPANQRVLMLSTSGEGRVVEDNTDQIAASLAEYNAHVPGAPDRGGFCSLQSAPEARSGAGAWSVALAALVGLGWLRRRNSR
jgi:hypothetical protein